MTDQQPLATTIEHELSKLPILARVDGRKAELDQMRPLAPEQEQRIWQKFRLDWNYHSNAIEGNSLDLGETRAFLMHGITAKGKPLKDYLDLRGHNEAIDYLLEFISGNQELMERDIRDLHAMILVEPYEMNAMTPDGQPVKRRIELGRYKTMPNHVRTATGEIHYYATPEETPIKMGELMAWYRTHRDDEAIHPVVLAALFHHRFAAIHPFDDGNGRLARLLMNLILMRAKYPPAIIPIEERNTYYLTLSQADSGDEAPFVEYLGERVLHALDLSLRGARGENIADPDDLDKRIALFKTRLQSEFDKIKQRRNPETLQNLYERTLVPLLNELDIVLGKFRDFFFDHKLSLASGTSTSWSYSTQYARDSDSRSLLSDGLKALNLDVDTTKCILVFGFDKFRIATNPFSVEVSVLFQFEEFNYSIHYDIAMPDTVRRLGLKISTPYELFPGKLLYHQEFTHRELAEAAKQLGENLLVYLTKKAENPNGITPLDEQPGPGRGSAW